ncbi:MAG: Rossmann-like and DUF2520 domain-containing protein [Thermincolia bacterium]
MKIQAVSFGTVLKVFNFGWINQLQTIPLGARGGPRRKHNKVFMCLSDGLSGRHFFLEEAMKKKIAIIGAGVVGSSIAILLHGKGYQVTGVASRNPVSAKVLGEKVASLITTDRVEEVTGEAEILLVTTPDREISPVAMRLAEADDFKAGTLVIHMSGALSSEVLEPVKKRGGLVLSLHPLQSFASVERALVSLPGTIFTLEGDDGGLTHGRELVADMGGQAVSIKAEDKVFYHGAACIAANYLVSLAHLAAGMFETIGFSREQGVQALLPLMQGVLDNVKSVGPVQALTGPIARGDGGTVAGHLAALAERAPEALDIYRLLGNYTLKIALDKGTISPDGALELVGLLKTGKGAGTDG